MNRKYVKHLLKEWLPIAIVAMALLVTPIFLVSMTTSLYNVYRTDSGALKPTESYGMLLAYGALLIGAIFFSCIMPFFVESYRYSKKSTDCYYSLPFKEGELRRIRTVIALIMIIAIFTICYWLPAIIYYIRYCNLVLPEAESGYSVIKKNDDESRLANRHFLYPNRFDILRFLRQFLLSPPKQRHYFRSYIASGWESLFGCLLPKLVPLVTLAPIHRRKRVECEFADLLTSLWSRISDIYVFRLFHESLRRQFG